MKPVWSWVPRGLLVGACVVWMVGSPGGAGAQCADELARKVFAAGQAYFEAGDYEEALRSFQRSFDLCPKADQLKNIGATHERMGNQPAAVAAYEKYVQMAPEADDRDAILVRIGNIKKRMAAAPSASSAPAAASSAPAPVEPPPVVPTVTATSAPVSAGPSRTTAVVVLGVSGAVAIGSLITGLVARGRYIDAENSCKPRCSDEQRDRVWNMALVSTIMSGAALAGVGVGTYLFVKSRPEPLQAGFRGVDAGFGPGQARLGASWAF